MNEHPMRGLIDLCESLTVGASRRLCEMSEIEIAAHNLLIEIRQRLDHFDHELRHNTNEVSWPFPKPFKIKLGFRPLSGKNRKIATKLLDHAYALVDDLTVAIENGIISPDNFVAYMEDEREDAIRQYEWNPDDAAAAHYKLRALKDTLATLSQLLPD